MGGEQRYGAIEAGGTKWVCAIAGADGTLLARERLPTTTPAETLGRAIAFLRAAGPLTAVGIGCFGPLDLRAGSPTHGFVTTTPKPGWTSVDVLGPIRDALGVPVGFDTDVNAAALGEWRRGAGRGLDAFAYVTVGTGIGAGAIVGGRPLHGLVHPELGHVRVPHDRARDPFEGCCPRHGDCLEGLASGEALRRRWGRPPEQLDEPAAWTLEADYLAAGLLNLICALSPQRVAVGGGVAQRPGLLEAVRARVVELNAGYLAAPELTDASAIESYLVAPALGDRAGVVGAVELARDAAAEAAAAPKDA